MKKRGVGAGAPRSYILWEWARGYAAWIVAFPLYCFLWAFARVFKRIPNWLLRKLLRDHAATTDRRQPDMRIPANPNEAPYMLRWWRIKRNPMMNIYYHIVRRSDEDRALHDHPWWNFSIVLVGGYYEHVINEGGVHVMTFYPAGSVRFRPRGTFAHRLELEQYDGSHATWLRSQGSGEMPVHTIFITGPVLRRWGFHAKNAWVDAYEWDAYCEANGMNTGMKMAGYMEGPKND